MRAIAHIIVHEERTSAMTMPIPSVPGHPVLGHLNTWRNDRTTLLLRLAKSHPEAAHLAMGVMRRVVVFSSPALVNEILTTKANAFVKAPGLAIFLRPILGNGLISSEHQLHERQRRLLAPAFTQKRIAGYATTMSERADRFARGLKDGETIDLSDGMMRLTFEIVGKTLFDAEVVSDASDVGEAITTAMEVVTQQMASVIPLPPAVPTPRNLRYRRAVRRLDSVIYRVIRERRAQDGDRGDVLSILLSARDEDGSAMADEQVRDETMTLFAAGHETTANALSWTFHLLAKNPEARARLEAEVDTLSAPPTYDDLKRLPYTLAVLKEAMRLYPPAYVVGRRNTEEIVIGDHVLSKNTIVIINIMGIHRRADLFADPERFDPERFLGDREKHLPRCAYMPFGAGPRVCIGNHFALMEGHLLLAAITRRARFDATDSAEVRCEPLVTLRPRGGLRMRVKLRAPS
jgi:cytochrome P450